MGRHASFDQYQVLDNALALFWSRGFAASSLRQLEDITELHPGSLYHHFHSKEGLYLEVLQHYLENQLIRRTEKNLLRGSPMDGLRRFFTAGYRHQKHEQYRNCCFLACATAELHLLPEEARSLVSTGLDIIRYALENQLRRMMENTQPQQLIACDEIARELTSFFLGLQLMARINPNQHQLDLLVKSTLKHFLPSS